MAQRFWQVRSTSPRSNGLGYFLLAVLAWAIVDFTTTAAVAHPLAYYRKYMPALLLFYVGYPLIFWALIYVVRLSGTGLFLAMLAGIVAVEIILSHNQLLVTFPICLLAIPISLGHYGMVTFMPMWLAERTWNQNRKRVAAVLGLWAFGVALNILSQFAGR